MLLLLLCGSRILLRSRARNDRAADETTDQRANSNAAVATAVTAPHLLGDGRCAGREIHAQEAPRSRRPKTP